MELFAFFIIHLFLKENLAMLELEIRFFCSANWVPNVSPLPYPLVTPTFKYESDDLLCSTSLFKKGKQNPNLIKTALQTL